MRRVSCLSNRWYLISVAAMVSCLGAQQLCAAELTSANYQQADNGAEMTFTVNDLTTEPYVFTTASPPRLVLEFSETFTDLPASPNVINEKLVRAFTTISDGARTRVIVDLQEPAEYSLSVNDDKVQMQLLASSRQVAATPAPVRATPTSTAGQSASQPGSANSGFTNTNFNAAPTQGRGKPGNEVEDIDFRRTSTGGGRIVFLLTSGGVSTAVNQRGDELLVDMMQTRVPASMEKTLDVQDFATPVVRIATTGNGENARASVRVNGDYTHQAYFDGSQFIVEVEPVVKPPTAVAEVDGTAKFFQNRAYSGDRVTFNFQDIPVRSVLQLIADVSDLNIVVSDSVTGNLTLRLQNVPWDQALDLVLDTKNLDKRQNGNVLWIAPTGEIAAREQQLLQAQRDKMQLEPLRTLMISVSYAEAVALAELITSASGSSGGGGSQDQQGLLSNRGSVTVDERTNTLLITDTAENLDEINDLIQILDRPVRQVLIESRIVIANDDFAHELGVRFGVTSTGESDKGSVFTTSGSINATDQTNNLALANRLAGRGSSLPNFINDDIDDGEGILVPSLNNRLNVNLPASNPAGRIGFSVLAADFLLDLELSALESEGRGEVISTPRVVTANQAEAFIQQGVEIPFEQATSSGASNVEFREAVLELRVTPLITPDDRVQLQLSVKQDTVGEIFPTAQGGQVPSIDTRELGTRVLIENGETIVLGGIFTEETAYSNEKVPLLGDIPVLGVLFRRRSNSSNKSELLMFVTPTILEERVRLP
ncbi:MAG: type IV pilus secretin PilQ [Gammaproteobacteria bacterium]|jgi:type IV pilus assembly protein PilQ|nr:type IV pilus secretin PilQ [Gammaproteobacteria bacterium]